MHETLRNLREVAPTLYFNVPNGFELIAHAMHSDDQLRRTLLSRVRMFSRRCALAQPIWGQPLRQRREGRRAHRQ